MCFSSIFLMFSICLFSVRTHRIRRRSSLVSGRFLPLDGQPIFLFAFCGIVLHLPSSAALRLMDLDASGAEISSANPTGNSWRHNIAPVRRRGQLFVILERREGNIEYEDYWRKASIPSVQPCSFSRGSAVGPAKMSFHTLRTELIAPEKNPDSRMIILKKR